MGLRLVDLGLKLEAEAKGLGMRAQDMRAFGAHGQLVRVRVGLELDACEVFSLVMRFRIQA